MVALSFRLLLPRLGQPTATTFYFKVAERILASIGSTRAVVFKLALGSATLHTVRRLPSNNRFPPDSAVGVQRTRV
jgi:hypothetical protein